MCLRDRHLDSSQPALSLLQVSGVNLLPDAINLPLVIGPDLRATLRHLRLHSDHHLSEHHNRTIDLLLRDNWLELTPAATTRLSRIGENDELIIDSGESETIEDYGVRYLDCELLESFINWLRDGRILSSVLMFVVKEIRSSMARLTGNKMSGSILESNHWRLLGLELDGRDRPEEDLNFTNTDHEGETDNEIDHHTDEGHSSLSESNQQVENKLIGSLRLSKLINSFLIACHAILLIKCAYSLGSSQGLFGSPGTFSSNPRLPTLPRASTSWILGYPSEYLLVVSLLDFLGSIHWYHSKDCFKTVSTTKNGNINYAFIENDNKRFSWLKWILLITASPCHTFRLAYAFTLIVLGPFGNLIGLMVGLYNSFSQTLCHIYNNHRIACYLKLLEANNENNIIIINGTSQQSVQLCRLRSGGKRDGWSNWPFDLATCDCEFMESYRFRVEKLLILVQVIGLKLTIFALLYYIDSRNENLATTNNDNNGRLEGGLSLFCMIEAFMAIHFYYDKYQTRYMANGASSQVECD